MLHTEGDKVVAFKSIISHRSGLAINTKVTQKEAEEGLNDILCGESYKIWGSYVYDCQVILIIDSVFPAGKPVRISNKNFSDYIFMHALEVAQNFNLPMQIDTG